MTISVRLCMCVCVLFVCFFFVVPCTGECRRIKARMFCRHERVCNDLNIAGIGELMLTDSHICCEFKFWGFLNIHCTRTTNCSLNVVLDNTFPQDLKNISDFNTEIITTTETGSVHITNNYYTDWRVELIGPALSLLFMILYQIYRYVMKRMRIRFTPSTPERQQGFDTPPRQQGEVILFDDLARPPIRIRPRAIPTSPGGKTRSGRSYLQPYRLPPQ